MNQAGTICVATFTKLLPDGERMLGGYDGVGVLTLTCSACDGFWNGYIDTSQLFKAMQNHAPRHTIRAVA